MELKRDINEEFSREATRVSVVCVACNLFLCALKLTAGVWGRSHALVGDAINSAFDVVSGVVALVGARYSRKRSDREHPYGHERYECVATIVLSILLLIAGLGVGHTALETLFSGAARSFAMPGKLTLVAAVLSIVAKELMFRYVKSSADKIDSSALRAAAWDCRADVLSTSGALVGVLASRYGFPQGDVVASLVVSFFIIRTAWLAFNEAIGLMVDRSCDDELLERLRRCVLSQEGVLGIDLLRVRAFGNRLYVDIEIVEDGNVSLAQAHAVAERVHDAVENEFPAVKHIMTHVNPTGERSEE